MHNDHFFPAEEFTHSSEKWLVPMLSVEFMRASDQKSFTFWSREK